jgi:hypothetical protein
VRYNLKGLFLILFLAGTFIASSGYAGEMIRVDKENGPLENLQVVLLFLSSIAFLLPMKRADRSCRSILLGGAMLCFSFILRELDVEDLAVPQWVIAVGSGTGRDILLGTGWAVVGVLAIKSFSFLKERFKLIFFSRTTMLLVISGLILYSGSFFDHKDNKTPADQLAEEIIEVIGYGIFLLGAILSRSMVHSLVDSTEERSNA